MDEDHIESDLVDLRRVKKALGLELSYSLRQSCHAMLKTTWVPGNQSLKKR